MKKVLLLGYFLIYSFFVAYPQTATVITDSIPYPFALALDSSETNLYVSCQGTSNVSKVNIATGSVEMLASNVGSYGVCFAKDYSKLFLGGGSSSASVIQTLTIPGYVKTTLATGFSAPSGLVLDQNGANIYVCDRKNHCIKKVDTSTGAVTTFYSGSGSIHLNGPYAMCFDKTYSNLYVCNSMGHSLYKISVPGGVVVDSIAADNIPQINYPMGIVMDPSGQNLYIASGMGNIYKVVLATKTVTEFRSGSVLPALGQVYNICMNKAGTYIYCGGLMSNRITRVALTATGIEDDAAFNERVSGFNLSQNYPNPFNPSTTIRYSLANPGIVSINIYDILGREVKALFMGNQNSGEHSFVFNAEALSSGIYICRVISGNEIRAVKMNLIK